MSSGAYMQLFICTESAFAQILSTFALQDLHQFVSISSSYAFNHSSKIGLALTAKSLALLYDRY